MKAGTTLKIKEEYKKNMEQPNSQKLANFKDDLTEKYKDQFKDQIKFKKYRHSYI